MSLSFLPCLCAKRWCGKVSITIKGKRENLSELTLFRFVYTGFFLQISCLSLIPDEYYIGSSSFDGMYSYEVGMSVQGHQEKQDYINFRFGTPFQRSVLSPHSWNEYWGLTMHTCKIFVWSMQERAVLYGVKWSVYTVFGWDGWWVDRLLLSDDLIPGWKGLCWVHSVILVWVDFCCGKGGDVEQGKGALQMRVTLLSWDVRIDWL